MPKYNVILADPPWTFKTYSDKGLDKSAQAHYDCMTIDDIKSIPVKDWVSDNSVLFIWCTWPTIFQAESVIKAWGFEYSGLAWEWLKWNDFTGKASFGTGYGTRKNVEPCLLARRGKPTIKSRAERDWMAEARREHSRKPDEQYRRIEAMFDGPYLEMFARQRRPNWDQWGNQVDKFNG
jgi:N6-adenosine-specific RNA methylase IME4